MQNRMMLGLVGVVLLAVCAGQFWLGRPNRLRPRHQGFPAGRGLDSADPDVAHRVCFMYTQNAAKNQWFGEVRLIVWGPSARLLAGDKDLQAKIKAMIKDGVVVRACIACTDSYGVTETLRGLGIEVKAMGKPLTDILQSDYKTLTF